MKNLVTRSQSEHSPRLAQIIARFGLEIKKHRIRLAHLVWASGLLGLGLTLLFAFFGDGMSFPSGMLKVLTGIGFICWGAYYAAKWEDDSLEDFENEQAKKQAAREAKRKERNLQAVGKINLN